MGASAQTPDVPRVLRNFGTKKNNVDHLKCCRKYTELTPLFAFHFPKSHTIYSISNILARLDISDTGTRTHARTMKVQNLQRFVFSNGYGAEKLLKPLPDGTLRIPLLRAFF